MGKGLDRKAEKSWPWNSRQGVIVSDAPTQRLLLRERLPIASKNHEMRSERERGFREREPLF
jgi:hypothetical protein